MNSPIVIILALIASFVIFKFLGTQSPLYQMTSNGNSYSDHQSQSLNNPYYINNDYQFEKEINLPYQYNNSLYTNKNENQLVNGSANIIDKIHTDKVNLAVNHRSISVPMLICESDRIMHLPRQVAEGYQNSDFIPNENQSPSYIGNYPLTNQSTDNQTPNQSNEYQTNQTNVGSNKVNWTSKGNIGQNGTTQYTPNEEYELLIQEFGVPKLIDKNRGGSATWRRNELIKKGVCWESLTIQDIPNDFIEIKYYIPVNNQIDENPQMVINQLERLSKSLNYHRSHQILVAHGNSVNQIIALLIVGKRFLSGEIDNQQATQLINTLPPQVDKLSPDYDHQLYNSLIDELCHGQYSSTNPPIIGQNHAYDTAPMPMQSQFGYQPPMQSRLGYQPPMQPQLGYQPPMQPPMQPQLAYQLPIPSQLGYQPPIMTYYDQPTMNPQTYNYAANPQQSYPVNYQYNYPVNPQYNYPVTPH